MSDADCLLHEPANKLALSIYSGLDSGFNRTFRDVCPGYVVFGMSHIDVVLTNCAGALYGMGDHLRDLEFVAKFTEVRDCLCKMLNQ